MGGKIMKIQKSVYSALFSLSNQIGFLIIFNWNLTESGKLNSLLNRY